MGFFHLQGGVDGLFKALNPKTIKSTSDLIRLIAAADLVNKIEKYMPSLYMIDQCFKQLYIYECLAINRL